MTIDPNKPWMILFNKKPMGPLSTAEIEKMLENRVLEGDELAYRVDSDHAESRWRRVREFPDFDEAFTHRSESPIENPDQPSTPLAITIESQTAQEPKEGAVSLAFNETPADSFAHAREPGESLPVEEPRVDLPDWPRFRRWNAIRFLLPIFLAVLFICFLLIGVEFVPTLMEMRGTASLPLLPSQK